MLTFDTLAYAKRLREAGFTEPQAEAQAAALAEVLKSGTGELATRQDIADLKRDLKEVELSLRREIEAMKAELLKWVIGLLLAQVALIAALVKIL